MRILVTGSEGTIGKPLVRALEANGHRVWGLDQMHSSREQYIRADVGSYHQISQAMVMKPFDVVYHLAAEFGRLNGEQYYDTLWRTNVIGTRNILELQRDLGFQLIFASTSEIYGNCTVSPLHEDLPLQQTILRYNDYAESKWVGETQCMRFAEQYGNEIVRLRFFNVYGPGELYTPYRNVISQFIYKALHRQQYPVYQFSSRSMCYIDDFIPTLAKVCGNFKADDVYNIGNPEPTSIEAIAGIIAHKVGWSGAVLHPPESHNARTKVPNINRAMAAFGHSPNVGIEEGIERTVAWMRETYKDSIPK